MMRFFKTISIALVLLLAGSNVAYAADGSGLQTEQELVCNTVIKVKGSSVEIENNTDAEVQVVVYGITGQIIKNVIVQPGVASIELSAGFYIVKAGNVASRIAVK